MKNKKFPSLLLSTLLFSGGLFLLIPNFANADYSATLNPVTVSGTTLSGNVDISLFAQNGNQICLKGVVGNQNISRGCLTISGATVSGTTLSGNVDVSIFSQNGNQICLKGVVGNQNISRGCLNIASTTYSCPSGGALSGTTCVVASCSTSTAPNFVGVCGNGKSVMLPSGCNYNHMYGSGGGYTYEDEYYCSNGTWNYARGDGGPGGTKEDSWSDSCGNTSDKYINCADNGCAVNTCNNTTCWNNTAWVQGTKVCADNSCAANTCTTNVCWNNLAWIPGTKSCPSVVNGACGPTSGQVIIGGNPPSTGLCSAGTPTGVSTSGGAEVFQWRCLGANGGTTANCQAFDESISCGSSNGLVLTDKPTTGLCSAWGNDNAIASAVGGSGPWSWTCTGELYGGIVSCSAQAGDNGCAANTCNNTTCWNNIAWVPGTKVCADNSCAANTCTTDVCWNNLAWISGTKICDNGCAASICSTSTCFNGISTVPGTLTPSYGSDTCAASTTSCAEDDCGKTIVTKSYSCKKYDLNNCAAPINCTSLCPAPETTKCPACPIEATNWNEISPENN